MTLKKLKRQKRKENHINYLCDIRRSDTSLTRIQFVKFNSRIILPLVPSTIYRTPVSDILHYNKNL